MSYLVPEPEPSTDSAEGSGEIRDKIANYQSLEPAQWLLGESFSNKHKQLVINCLFESFILLFTIYYEFIS